MTACHNSLKPKIPVCGSNERARARNKRQKTLADSPERAMVSPFSPSNRPEIHEASIVPKIKAATRLNTPEIPYNKDMRTAGIAFRIHGLILESR